jgi:hypothetical protein
MAFATAAIVGASVAGAAGLGKTISGIGQVSKGKKALRAAEKLNPGYQIPKEFEENLAKSENMARTGLPSQEYNLATTNIQRGTQAGLRQLGRMSNPFAGIAGLARSQSDALGKLDVANAQARRQNILQAMGARRELAGQKLAAQQYQQQRYFDAVNQANALIGAGRQNTAGGLSSIGNAGLSLVGAGSKSTTDTTTTTPSATSNLGIGYYNAPQDVINVNGRVTPNNNEYSNYPGPRRGY